MDMRHSFVKQKWNIFRKCLVCRKRFGRKMWRCVDCPFRCHASCAAGAVDYEMANQQSIGTVNVNVNTYGSEPIELKDVPSVDRRDSTELVVAPEKETFGIRHSAKFSIHQEINTEFIFKLPALQYYLHDKTTLADLSCPVVIRRPTTVHGTSRPNRLTQQQPPSDEHVAAKTSTENDRETMHTPPFAEFVAEIDHRATNDTAAEQPFVEIDYFPEIRGPLYNGFYFGGNHS